MRPGIRKDVEEAEHKYRHVSDELRAQMREAASSPKIWHYMGRKKPWIRKERQRTMASQAFRDYASALREFRNQTDIDFGM